jgi:hypothetical protein
MTDDWEARRRKKRRIGLRASMRLISQHGQRDGSTGRENRLFPLPAAASLTYEEAAVGRKQRAGKMPDAKSTETHRDQRVAI